MDEVAGGVFIGTIEDAGNASLLHEHDISVIISLTHGVPDGGFPSGLKIVNVAMVDGPQNDRQTFEQGVSEVLSSLEDDERILVHCSAGASRSPAVAATAIALQNDIDLEDAFQQLAQRRPAVDPHPALVRQAAAVYDDMR